MVYVPLRVEDVNMLRLMVRVLTVNRLLEAISTLRPLPKETVTDLRIATEILKYTDVYRQYDHQLCVVWETMNASSLPEARVPMSPDRAKFYRGICEAAFEPGVINSKLWTGMVESCRNAQVALKARFDVDGLEPAIAGASVNVPPASGMN